VASRPSLEPPPDLEGFEVDDSLLLLTWSTRAGSHEPASLTAAESRVLDLVLAGHSNAEIAVRRGRSPRTIAHQVERIFTKLGVRSRAELFARFCRDR
jgi:DNA-binding CsgD family transcriptional regulator